MKISCAPRVPGLLAVTWPWLGVALAQAVLMIVSLALLSSVQAYMRLESHWCRGIKDAALYLHRYTVSLDEADFRHYRAAISKPLGYRDARLAMEAGTVDEAAVRAGFLAGGSMASDVPGMVWLFRNFEHVNYLMRARRVWATSDPSLLALARLGDEIHGVIEGGAIDAQRVTAWQGRLQLLNASLDDAGTTAIALLAHGTRSSIVALMALNLGAAAGLIALGILTTRRLLRQRRLAEAALAREQALADITLASIGDAVLRTDAMGRINYMNDAAEGLLARSGHTLRLLPLSEALRLTDEQGEHNPAELLERIMTGETGVTKAGELLRDDGSHVSVSLVATAIRDDSGVIGSVLVLRDTTRERQYVATLSWQANHDALTGLVNRREFERRLTRAIERVQEHGGRHALLFLDLDQFKVVNDTCGHDAGDQLLCLATTQLQNCLRDRDTLARLGGDEFGILLENCAEEPAVQIAEKLRQTVRDIDFSSAGRSFRIGASIGVVSLHATQFTPEEALRAADMACYMAKEKGRNRVQLYDAEDAEFARRFGDMIWAQRIHKALVEDRFCLYRQDVMALRDDDTGWHFELLLRLLDEAGLPIPPGQFLPTAERFGLMPQIDRWVVQAALAVLGRWRRSPGMRRVDTCAINLSASTLADPGFAEFLHSQLVAHEVEPRVICFELKESAALQNLAATVRFVHALRNIGCRFAVDNFGAGVASFAYLKQLPVDYVKIDGGFVRDMANDPVDDVMIDMINKLARLTGKRTVAEFIERTEALELLRSIGVDYAQGFAVSKPEPFNEAPARPASNSSKARLRESPPA